MFLGIAYNSKLDEFVSFVESMRKYPSLSSFSKENSKKPFILLIDDLPVANTGVSYKRLSKCLQLLVQLSQVPTVFLFTEMRRCDSMYSNARNQEDLISDLERAGACKVPAMYLNSYNFCGLFSRQLNKAQIHNVFKHHAIKVDKWVAHKLMEDN